MALGFKTEVKETKGELMGNEEQKAEGGISPERLGILKIIVVIGLLIISFYGEFIRERYGIRIPLVNSILGAIVGWELFAKKINRKWRKAVIVPVIMIIMILSIFFLSLFLQVLYPAVFFFAVYLIHIERKKAAFGRREYWTLNVIIAAIILEIPLLYLMFLIELFLLPSLFLLIIVAIATWLFCREGASA